MRQLHTITSRVARLFVLGILADSLALSSVPTIATALPRAPTCDTVDVRGTADTNAKAFQFAADAPGCVLSGSGEGGRKGWAPPSNDRPTVSQVHDIHAFGPDSEGNPCVIANVSFDLGVGREIICLRPAEAAEPAAEQVVFTVSDFRSLPINPGTATVMGGGGWVLVNIETIVYTDAAPQTFDVTLLNTPVQVTATPVRHLWDFRDGHTLTTTEPGAPWPNHTVYHVYEQATAPGAPHQIGLSTVWQGSYSVAGGPTQPITGFVTTHTETAPVEVRTVRTYLTTDPELATRR